MESIRNRSDNGSVSDPFYMQDASSKDSGDASVISDRNRTVQKYKKEGGF